MFATLFQVHDRLRQFAHLDPIALADIDAMISCSVVIPVYNSSPCLPELASRLTEVFSEIAADYEIIMVDDCSSDASWHVVEMLARTRPHFKGVQLMKNCGQARATITGIAMAKGDVVITMDDDLQHDPKSLPHLLRELDENGGYDCVFAYFPEKMHAGYRNIGSRIISWIASRAVGTSEIRMSSLRLMRGSVAEIVRRNQATAVTVGGLILANTARIKSVPIPHSPRFSGRTNYTLAKQLRLAFDNIASVSMLPLRMISAAGLLTIGVSGILLCYVLVDHFLNRAQEPGWISLVTLITFFAGLILLSLGVIGEYLVRVLRELQRTSVIAIRRTVGFASGETMHADQEQVANAAAASVGLIGIEAGRS